MAQTKTDPAALLKRAALQAKANRNARAVNLYRRAIAALEAGGISENELATAYRSLAFAYFGMARRRKTARSANMQLALAAFSQAIKLWESGPHDDEFAANLHNLGALYVRNGQYQAGATLFERALSIQEEHADPHGEARLATWNQLGATYGRLGRFADAERILNYGLAVLDRANPDTSHLLGTLADVYQMKAEDLRKRAAALAPAST